MSLDLKTAMSSIVLLSVVLVQIVSGTFFPAVSNPPPIPGQGVRTVNSQPQQIYVREEFSSGAQPVINEGLFPSDAKPNEPRWYIQENQSGESGDIQSSLEAFDRFYPNGEPAIGPVATPMPDDSYVAEPSSISKVNPSDASNSGASDIWILTRGANNQYTPEKWVQIQVPSERLVEIVNQEQVPVLATDTVKSVAAPVPPAVSVKSQFVPDTPNIVQQVWVQAPDAIASQKSYGGPTTVVEEIPSVKQIVEIPPGNVKQIVTQQITKDSLSIPPPPPPAVISKSSFIAPPPPPPSLKGADVSPKVISSVPVNIVPDANILNTDKSGYFQQMRHIWIPTSPNTGKFISVPVSSAINSGKSIVNKGVPLDTQPVAVSDTWVLNQNGPIPSFEQQKYILPSPVVQNSKVVVQDSPVFQVNAIPAPPVVTQVTSPKNAPVIDKGFSPAVQVDIWPPRKDINSKVYEKSPAVINSKFPPPPPPAVAKTDTIVLSKSFPADNGAPFLPASKGIPLLSSEKGVPLLPPGKSVSLLPAEKGTPLPAPLPPPSVQIINGKPCPLPVPPQPLPQKSLFPPSNSPVITIPRIIATQRKQPLTRIIRINRYPTGSYYLLNSRVTPSIFNYPAPAFLRQSNPRLVRLVQSKQIPIPVQSRPVLPFQAKQISIPVQSKQIPIPITAGQVAFPFSGRQLIVPVPPAKSRRIIYPGVQAIRYAYPWNAFIKSNPVPGNRVLVPQLSPLKKISPVSKSSSSSSESSSSGSSSEESGEGKKEEKQEEKIKAEDKPQNEESSASGEKETEKEESESKPAESEENVSETQSKESIETAESQVVHSYANIAALPNSDDDTRRMNKPYVFRYDHRDSNGTVQHRQEASDVEGRVTGTYGYFDPTGLYRHANYIADREGFRVKLESNEPGTITHESAHANFVSNPVTQYGDSTGDGITTDS